MNISQVKLFLQRQEIPNLGPVWLLFFCLKKKEKENRENTLGSYSFFVLKNTKNMENTHFREGQFSENTKMVFFVFSKNVLKNNCQK